MNRNFPAFGKPRTNSSMRKNKYHDEEEAARLTEIARKTEFNEINFPSLGGHDSVEGWGGEQSVGQNIKEYKNKWVELASDWKIHDIVEKQYADMKKEEEERKQQGFSRIIPKIYVEKTNFGTTHSKYEDTYEEDPYVEYPIVSRSQEENSDDGWNTVAPKPKKVKKPKTRIEIPSGPSDDNGPSIWENDDDYNPYEIFKARSGAY
jgi:hypothetical protein